MPARHSVRPSRPRYRLVGLVALLASNACGSDHKAAPPPAQAESPAKGDPSAAAAQPEPAGHEQDPDRAAKLADLDMLCAALNKDYVDGTLSDYFAGLEPKTEWGKQTRTRGSEADQPGRFLEKQIASLSPNAADPALPACRELLDYIDEVE